MTNTVLLADLFEFLDKHHLRIVRCYWTSHKEFVVEVAINSEGATADESH
jgi:hypothetical protein